MKTTLKTLALGAVLAASSIPANAQLDYKVSWVGNTFGKENSNKWVQNNIAALYVAPDGTCYTNSNWDEGHHEGGIYKNGDYVGNIADLHMNNAWGGFAVAGDNSFLYVANGDQLRRHNLNGARGDWTVSVGGTIQGLAVDKVNGLIYSADQSDGTGDGEIRCYNLTTKTLVAQWSSPSPRRIAVAPDGTIWVSQRKSGATPGKVRHYSASGTLLSQSIEGAAANPNFDPTALVFDGAGRLLVGDNGTDQQVKIYTDLGNASPTLAATLGAKGGIFSGVAGQVAPLKFNGITGLGVDSAGNIYVSQNRFGPEVNFNSAGAGSILQSYTASGSLNWQLLGLEFVDCGDFTPGTDGAEIYTKYARYSMDYSKTAPGSEWSYAAHTLNGFKYPTDTRYEKRNDNYDFSTGYAVRIIGGKKFQFNNSMWGNRLEVYRFNAATDGEIAIPSGEITKNSIWRDLNGNGAKESNEWAGMSEPSGNGVTGITIDNAGNIWQCYPNGGSGGSGVRQFTVQGLDANGSPIWNVANSTVAAQPAPFSEIYRMEYISETDTMYLAGYSQTLAPGLGWNGPDFNIKGIGAVIARYNNWSAGNRVAAWTQVFSDYRKTPTSMAIAGDFIFIGYDGLSYQPDSGITRVRRASDGVDVGLMWAGPYNIGRMDIENGVRAMKRSGGEYLVLTEDDWYARVMLYRWTPPATAPVATASLTATAGNAYVKLNWSATSGASLYRVKRGTSVNGPFTTLTTLEGTTFTDTGGGAGLTNGTTYYYTIQGVGPGGDSPDATPKAATPSGLLALRIDSGRWTDLGDWIADSFVSGGGDTLAVSNMNTSGVTNPAPADVYKTVRRKGDPITYTFPGQNAGVNYKLRLHFGEWWFNAGGRKLNLLVNGVQLVTDFDVNALAGGLNKAYVKEFVNVNPDANGKITVAVAKGGETMISGIELIPPTTITTNLSPTGDTFVRDGSYGSTAYGSATTMLAKNVTNGSGYTRWSYVKFDTTGLGTISSAKVRLYGNVSNTLTPSVDVSVYGQQFTSSSPEWSESTLTWNNKMLPLSTALATKTVIGTGQTLYEWDVTAFAQSEASAGRRKFGLVFKAIQANIDPVVVFNTKEAATNKPVLVVQSG